MSHCDTKTLLKSSNIRATAKKTAILDEFIMSSSPLCASDLYETLLGGEASMNLTTVYRTLTVLRDAGIIREAGDISGVKYYEIACKHNPVHPHFTCTKCNKIECLPSIGEVNTKLISSFAGDCEVHEISITLTGLCPECRGEGT